MSLPEDYFIKDLAEQDLPQLLEIVNWMIVNTNSIWRHEKDKLETRQAWFKTTKAAGYPIIGLYEKASGNLLGFTSSGSFRNGDGYRYTTECSISMRSDHTGKGLGRILLHTLLRRLHETGFAVVIAGISGSNQGSARFFQREGFVKTASMPSIGVKNGQMLDLEFWQLDIREYKPPQVDGTSPLDAFSL